jgi:Type ISP C-terminal specificity domain/N-6 DNA Methylase
MHPLETYLTSLYEIKSSGAGVDETSYYGALEAFFNEVGKSLKPNVRCILQLKNRGAGSPDGGLFTDDQYKKTPGQVPIEGQIPSRGAVEVKPTSDDAWVTADGEQVTRYRGKYRQVLVTNLRDFVFVSQDAFGQPVKLEGYRLADSEKEFWQTAAHAKKTTALHGPMFVEFAKRAMLHAAPLAAPQDVAEFLASYARDALARIGFHDLPALAGVRKALEEALGLAFEGPKGEHFFRSTLVQTLFYGVFSAWVLWAKQQKTAAKEKFDWRLTAHFLRVPVLRKLFHEVADPGQLEDLNLAEILDWTARVLNRVDRAHFFAKFEEGHAVQYFYEPFLEKFDPELRKQLGVWYTPPEIVKYMVARVDTVLREELNLADGFADKNVYVLDPCCGTGSYLVEVLKKIHETLRQRGGDALVAADLKEAAQTRVFGFELLPAPFVVSHLQLGLLLQNLGAPLSEKANERIAVFLTNALTGWEPPREPKKQLLFSELEDERDAAEQVKRNTPILVILGNPPYNGFAGVAVKEERALTTAYRTTKKVATPQGQGLNDLYVRFYRMAERRITEMSGYGIACFISNYSWLDGLSFSGMRESYLEKFDLIWIDNLHGDRIISEYAPSGETSETIFAVQGTSPGIKIGTAIALLVKKRNRTSTSPRILYRDRTEARASARRQALLASLATQDINRDYAEIKPILELALPLKPSSVGTGYLSWPLLTELFPTFFPGVQTKRDEFVVDIDRSALLARVERYFDGEISDEEMRRISPRSMENTAQYHAKAVRQTLQKRGFRLEYLVKHCYRPFDVRWIYWEPEAGLLSRRSPDYFPQVFNGNVWIVSQHMPRREWSRPQVIQSIGCLDLMDRGASCFPLLTRPNDDHQLSFGARRGNDPVPNISKALKGYLTHIGTPVVPEHAFLSAVALMHAPNYYVQNLGGLRRTWPRIPIPNSKPALLASAELGRQVATLLDIESPAQGVTAGNLRPELRFIASPARAGGGDLMQSDLEVKVGWGHLGKGGVTMPSKGRLIEREYSALERKSFTEGAKALGLSDSEILRQLGRRTFDV